MQTFLGHPWDGEAQYLGKCGTRGLTFHQTLCPLLAPLDHHNSYTCSTPSPPRFLTVCHPSCPAFPEELSLTGWPSLFLCHSLCFPRTPTLKGLLPHHCFLCLLVCSTLPKLSPCMVTISFKSGAFLSTHLRVPVAVKHLWTSVVSIVCPCASWKLLQTPWPIRLFQKIPWHLNTQRNSRGLSDLSPHADTLSSDTVGKSCYKYALKLLVPKHQLTDKCWSGCMKTTPGSAPEIMISCFQGLVWESVFRKRSLSSEISSSAHLGICFRWKREGRCSPGEVLSLLALNRMISTTSSLPGHWAVRHTYCIRQNLFWDRDRENRKRKEKKKNL